MRDARNGRSKGFRLPVPACLPACLSLGRPLPPPAPLWMSVASPPAPIASGAACLLGSVPLLLPAAFFSETEENCQMLLPLYCICRRPESGDLPSICGMAASKRVTLCSSAELLAWEGEPEDRGAKGTHSADRWSCSRWTPTWRCLRK